MSVHPPVSTNTLNTLVRKPSIENNNRENFQCSGSKLSRQLQQPHVTLVEYKSVRFLITDQPTNSNMDNFIMACKLHKVRKLVRVCEPMYDKEPIEAAGIEVIDLEYDDGTAPPDTVIEMWFQLIVDLLQQFPDGCLAVHCKAGLGRAPALVGAALIELGLQYDEAVELIRGRRSGALNARQIQYLKNFRPRKRLRNLKHQNEKCCIL